MKKMSSLALALALCLSLTVPASAFEVSKVGQVSTVSLGDYHMGVVDTNGSLWMCGDNKDGQLGNGTKNSSTPLIKVMDDVVSVSCGDRFTAAIKTDGSLWMWGFNADGALTGDNKREYILTPKKVTDDVVAVSCGDGFTAAIKMDGSLWMWGNNYNGQLGNGTTENSTVPVRIMEDVADVSCGSRRTAAIKTDGTLWMWGNNGPLSLGMENENSDNPFVTRPVKIMSDVTAVSCGPATTAAIKTDGSLWIWGSNSHGQLLDGSAGMFRRSAEQRKVMDNVVAVSCGFSQVAAVKADGSLWTWGGNIRGQLGNGGAATHHYETGEPLQLEPVKVMEDVASVSCSFLNTVAVKKDGSVWGFGRSDMLCGISNAIDPYGFPMQTVPARLTEMTAKLSSPAIIAAKVGGFNDVLETDYYADAVLWAVDKGITSGTSATAFSPDATCTTAQILTFLYRAAGSPEPTIKNPFSDVKESDYFYKAALWAKEQGLVSGTAFYGDTPCTRSATVTYLWKLAGSPSASPATFADVPGTADFSQAVAWAVKDGITSGTSATTFGPETVCTRGQIVTFLYRAY